MRMLLLTLLIGLSPWCMAAQIYKWVDAQGVTHFDAQPPQGQPSTIVQPPPRLRRNLRLRRAVVYWGIKRPSIARSRNKSPINKRNSRRFASRHGRTWRNCRTIRVCVRKWREKRVG